MKKTNVLILLTLILFSCKTTEVTEEQPEKVQETLIETVEKTVEIIDEETGIIEVEEPETTVKEGIVVSEDLYNKTFEEIENLIKNLTQLIRKKNFNGWKKFLSERYIETVESADYLNKISEKPSLKNVAKLEDLRDYFQWVVVPSRANARLDEIVFKDELHVTAYMYIEDNRTILFQFEFIENMWAITIW